MCSNSTMTIYSEQCTRKLIKTTESIDRVSDDITMPIAGRTADRSKLRPFKSMVKLLHTRNFKQIL